MGGLKKRKGAKRGKNGEGVKKDNHGKKSRKGNKKSRKTKKLKKTNKTKKGKKEKKSRNGKKKSGKTKKLNKLKKQKKKQGKRKSKKEQRLKEKKRNKLNRLRNKKRKNKGKRQSCGADQVSIDVIKNMMEVMEFQRNQMYNMEVQIARAKSQAKIANGKAGNANDFKVPAQNLANAIGINETNKDKPTCQGSTTTKQSEALAALADYKFLMNCTSSIEPACSASKLYDAEIQARLEECGKKQKAFVDANEVCLKKPSNEAATCWEAQLKAVTDIKESKCTADVKKSQDAVAKLKNDCLASFVACKKKEDAAVSHSANCTEGTVKSVSDINKQTIYTKDTRAWDPVADEEDPDEEDFME